MRIETEKIKKDIRIVKTKIRKKITKIAKATGMQEEETIDRETENNKEIQSKRDIDKVIYK